MSNLSTDFDPELIQEYFRRKALETRVFESGMLKYATRQRMDIPMRNSKVAHFHKWNELPLADTVAEGSDPSAGVNMTLTEVKVQMEILASYLDIPKEGDEILIDSVIDESYPRFKQQLERTANNKLVSAICAGNSTSPNDFDPATKIFGSGKSSFASMVADVAPLRSKDIQEAVSLLELAGAPKIDGGYVCCLDPVGKKQLLKDDSEFRELISYTSPEMLKKGVIGSIGNARFELQDEPMIQASSTQNTYNSGGAIRSAYVFGAQAFCVTQLMGKTGLNPKFKVTDTTKTGALMSIGWRTYFAAAVLDPEWVIQIDFHAGSGS